MKELDKKRVLFIIPSLVGGGAERVLINLLNRFDFHRFEVTLCVVEKKGVYLDQVPEEVRVISLFTNRFFLAALRLLHVRYKCNFFYKKYVVNQMREYYDVGISFLDTSYTDLLFFLKGQIDTKITWVHASYGSDRNFYKFLKNDDYRKRVIRDRYSKLDTIVFVSHDSKRQFIKLLGEFPNMRVIYNVLDTAAVKDKASGDLPQVFENDKIHIVSLGSLLPVKAHDRLIDAALLLKRDQLPVKIRIVGSGYLREDLENRIRELALEDIVELVGFQSNPYPFLKHSDIFVMTSISEGLPTALSEAMILGLPTVVTNCSGCREIVDYGKYGMMVDQDVEAIYKGIKELVENPSKRAELKKSSLERSKIFDDDRIMEQVYEVITE